MHCKIIISKYKIYSKVLLKQNVKPLQYSSCHQTFLSFKRLYKRFLDENNITLSSNFSERTNTNSNTIQEISWKHDGEGLGNTTSMSSTTNDDGND